MTELLKTRASTHKSRGSNSCGPMSAHDAQLGQRSRWEDLNPESLSGRYQFLGDGNGLGWVEPIGGLAGFSEEGDRLQLHCGIVADSIHDAVEADFKQSAGQFLSGFVVGAHRVGSSDPEGAEHGAVGQIGNFDVMAHGEF